MKNLNKFKKIIIVALILGIVLPFFPLTKPKQAEAIAIPAVIAVPVVEVPGPLMILTADIAFNTSMLVEKEYVLDPIAYGAQKVVQEVTTNVVLNWIVNSFPGGNALFPQNFINFPLDLGDERIGAFLSDLTAILGNVCEPFRPDLLKPLQVKATPRERNLAFDIRIDCTLDGFVIDINAFYEGDFFAGGWDGFLAMNSEMQNNPYGSELIASMEMEKLAEQEETATLAELDAGEGLAGIRRCIDSSGGFCKLWEITTPGSPISEVLGFAGFDSTFENLQDADEFSELLLMFIGMLLSLAFGPNAGLGGILDMF